MSIKIFLITVLCALAIYFSSLAMQFISYDMVVYVAAAYKEDGYVGSEINVHTVHDIKSSVSEEKFDGLLSGSQFWSSVINDPKSLNQQIPMYSMRVAYISSMRLLHSFGITYTNATRQIAAFFGGLTVIILAMLMLKINLNLGFLPIIIGATNLLYVSYIPSPDTFACFMFLLAIYFLISNHDKWLLVISAFLPLVRTDLILLSVTLMGYLYWNRKPKWSAMNIGRIRLYFTPLPLFSLLISFIVFWGANSYAGNYGLLNLFNNHHINPSLYPAEIEISTKPRDYILPYFWMARDMLNHWHSIIYLIIAVIYLRLKKLDLTVEFFGPFLVLPILYVFLHIAIFPVYFDRYFISSILLLILWILSSINKFGIKR